MVCGDRNNSATISGNDRCVVSTGSRRSSAVVSADAPGAGTVLGGESGSPARGLNELSSAGGRGVPGEGDLERPEAVLAGRAGCNQASLLDRSAEGLDHLRVGILGERG